jgi:hypothetical protein
MRAPRVSFAVAAVVAVSWLRGAGQASADVTKADVSKADVSKADGELPKADPLRPDDSAPARDDAAAAHARALYDTGTQAFARGRYLEAALDFEVAATFKRSAIALYTAALSWERANSPERAADDYARAVVVGDLPPDTATAASLRLTQLRKVLGVVAVTAPADWRVQLDDHGEVEPPATLHGAAGVHTITARAPGQPLQRVSVVLRAGEIAAPLALPSTSAAPAPDGSTRSGPPARQLAGSVAMGAGFSALLAGTLLGLEALDARNAYDASPSHATFEHANSLSLWTDVALASGGVLLAGGLVLVLWPSPRTVSTTTRGRLVVAPHPGGVVFRGDF